MSLLMDALRKAEEARKKAEAEARGEQESGGERQSGVIDPEFRDQEDEPTLGPELENSEDEEGLEFSLAAEEEDRQSTGASEFYSDPDDADSEPSESSLNAEPPIAIERDAETKERPTRRDETDYSLTGASLAPIEQEAAAPEPTASERATRTGSKQTAVTDAPQWQLQPLSDQSETAAGVSRNESPIRAQSAGRRASARSVFTAKRSPRAASQRRLLLAGGAAVLLVVVGFVTYFVIELNSSSGIVIPPQAQFGSSEPTDSPTLESAGDGSQADQPPQESLATAATSPVTSAGGSTPEAATEEQESRGTAGAQDVAPSEFVTIAQAEDSLVAGNEPGTAAPAPVSAGDLGTSPALAQNELVVPARGDTVTVAQSAATVDSGLADAELQAGSAAPQQEREADTSTLISFTRSLPASSDNSLLRTAFAAYQQGNFELARQRYEAVLQTTPLHRGALLGLADLAIEMRQPSRAMELYAKLLSRDPADPVARAGLMELSPVGGPAIRERELRRLQALHPDVAPLSYALGNFYAERGQWRDAQSYYFQALQLARTNVSQSGEISPDYAFNLAVSLEHLNQPEAARRFYEEALTLASSHPPRFSVAAVRSRLAALSVSGGASP